MALSFVKFISRPSNYGTNVFFELCGLIIIFQVEACVFYYLLLNHNDSCEISHRI